MRAVIAGGILLMLTSEALAVPVTTGLTARVSNEEGPVDGPVSLTFRLYDAASGGALQWQEVHEDVSADNGLVFVELGKNVALDESIFTGESRFLEIVVEDAVQSPRLPIGSVPYAIRASHAKTAEALGSLLPEDLATVDHVHSTGDLVSSGSDDGVVFHDCRWARSNENSASFSVSCPSGFYPLSGSCASGSSSISVTRSRPSGGVFDGNSPTVTSSWSCGFSSANSLNLAFAMCCRY
jgi:hypothetical protein